ncbi:MAG: NAD-dependent epimerase/dehydratase family protein [Candidatus Hodarchaeales archaeon]
MRILVTGGAGYVGTTLVPMLLEKGYQVRVLDNLTYGGNGLLPNFLNPKFEFVKGDIADLSVVQEAIKGVDAIIHLAALVGYPACKRYPDIAEKSNVQGTKNLIMAKSPEQLFVFASTGSVYGVVTDKICTEETALNAISIYGENKIRGEEIVRSSDNWIIYRFATAFGISPRLRLDLMINNFVYQALKNNSLIVYEKSFKRTFIHVKDMARSFIFALDNEDKLKGNTYNVGDSSMNFTKEEVCNKIKEHINYYLHFADFDADADKRNYEVSYTKINKKGFKTVVSMDEGIDELIKALKVIDIPNLYSNHAIL